MESFIHSILPNFTIAQYLITAVALGISYTAMFFACKKIGLDLKRASLIYLIVIYVIYILYKTVLSRTPLEENVNYLFRFFWSYKKPMKFIRAQIIREIIINLLMLAPLGFALPLVLKKHKLIVTTGIGFSISICIELLQLVTKTGFSEFDDIFHNTLGIFISASICLLIAKFLNVKNSRERKSI